jgi:GWxTD domain-containing protein
MRLHVHRKITFIVTLLLAVSVLGADDLLKWNKTPEAYYMTTEEKAAWKNVRTPEQAQAFIDDFYRKRGDQFKKDVRTRIDIADKQFKLDKTSGSLTQKGRVFMLLGTPNQARTNRNVDDARAGVAGIPQVGGGSIGGIGGSQSATDRLENQAVMGTTWVYEKDHLPAELGLSQLKVNFVYDARRGLESIDNLGNVEPQLQKVADLLASKYMAAASAQTAQRSAPAGAASTAAAMALDPLWASTPALNGAIFTGDAFLSPTEQPYYAYSFYVPKSAAAFADWKSGLLVTLVRNEAGQQVISQRAPIDLSAYDTASGARFIDRSVALEPGKYEGIFALYSPDGGTLLSSHRTSFEVAPKEASRASSLFLTSRIDTLEKQDPLDPFTFVATKYVVRADRTFRTADKLAFFTIISNPTGSPEPNLMQKMILKRDGKEFAKTPLEPVQLTQTGPNTFLVGNAFEPETFPAGHYTLELQVRDMNAPDASPLKKQGYVLTNEFDVVK